MLIILIGMNKIVKTDCLMVIMLKEHYIGLQLRELMAIGKKLRILRMV